MSEALKDGPEGQTFGKKATTSHPEKEGSAIRKVKEMEEQDPEKPVDKEALDRQLGKVMWEERNVGKKDRESRRVH